MELDNAYTLNEENLSDGLESLSQIFNDPLLNELTDRLLTDIDVNEFGELLCPDDNPNDNFEVELRYSDKNENQSNQSTLEALLKSKSLSSCVPPAPELRLDTREVVKKEGDECQFDVDFDEPNLQSASLPVLLGARDKFKTKCESSETFLKSKLICNLLDKSPTSSLQCTNTFQSTARATSEHVIPISIRGAHAYSLTNVSQPDENPVRKAPHNAIEKRYRASINERIDELRRILVPFPNGDTKINKSAVLRLAIDRIRVLEEKNAQLQTEVRTLRSLLQANPTVKSLGSSPESGISSFEPSPTSSSFIGYDRGNVTPSSGIMDLGTNQMVNKTNDSGAPLHADASSDNIETQTLFAFNNSRRDHLITSPSHEPKLTHNSLVAKDFVNLTHNHMLDGGNVDQVSRFTAVDNCFPSACCHSVAAEQNPPRLPTMSEFLGAGISTGVSHNSEQMNFPNLGGSNDSSVIGGKRSADGLYPKPAKVRREFLDSVTVPYGSTEVPTYQPNSLHQTAFREIQPTQAPTVRKLLYASDVHGSGNHGPDQSGPMRSFGSGFSGVAARTTLCVAALCLLTLDPAMWTGTPTVSTSQNAPSSSTRRLLSLLTTLSPQDSSIESTESWVVHIGWILQWSVVILFCLWICRKRTVPEQDARAFYVAASESAALHWNKANAALAQIFHGFLHKTMTLDATGENRKCLRYIQNNSNLYSTSETHYSNEIEALNTVPSALPQFTLMNDILKEYKVILFYIWSILGITLSEYTEMVALTFNLLRFPFILSKSSWALAQQHLCLCLVDLDAPLLNRQYIGDESSNSCSYVHGWLLLFIESTWFVMTRIPCWLWAFYIMPMFRHSRGSPVRSKSPRPSTYPSSSAEVRLRLLELYLLVEDRRSGNSPSLFIDPLAWFRLILSCVRDFIDGSIRAISSGTAKTAKKQLHSPDCRLRTELLVRQGVTLLLVLRHKAVHSWMTRLFAHLVTELIQKLPDDTIWGHWMMNPVVKSIFLDRLPLRPVQQGATSEPVPTVSEMIQQRLISHLKNQCIRAMVHHTHYRLINLGPYVHTLVELTSNKYAEYLALESSRFLWLSSPNSFTHVVGSETAKAMVTLERDRWWAQATYVTWSYRSHAYLHDCEERRPITVEGVSSLPPLKEPSSVVLSCPDSGPIARAIWLIYRSIADLKQSDLSNAIEACKLLKAHLKRVFDGRTSVSDSGLVICIDNTSIPFELLAWELIASDCALELICHPLAKFKTIDSEIAMPLSVRTECMNASMIGRWTFRFAADLISAEKPHWIQMKLSYGDAVSRLLMGSNPVRTRLKLLHDCHEVTKLSSEIFNPVKALDSYITWRQVTTRAQVPEKCTGSGDLFTFGSHDDRVGATEVHKFTEKSSLRHSSVMQSPGR